MGRLHLPCPGKSGTRSKAPYLMGGRMGEHSSVLDQPPAGARLARSTKFILVAACDCSGLHWDLISAQALGSSPFAFGLFVPHDSTRADEGVVCMRRSTCWRICSRGVLGKPNSLTGKCERASAETRAPRTGQRCHIASDSSVGRIGRSSFLGSHHQPLLTEINRVVAVRNWTFMVVSGPGGRVSSKRKAAGQCL